MSFILISDCPVCGAVIVRPSRLHKDCDRCELWSVRLLSGGAL